MGNYTFDSLAKGKSVTILPIDTKGSMRDVFDEIVRERIAQDNKWGGFDHDIEHSEWDWRHFVISHTERAVDINFRKQMIRVAALAIAAIQAYDIKKAMQKKIVDLGTTLEER